MSSIGDVILRGVDHAETSASPPPPTPDPEELAMLRSTARKWFAGLPRLADAGAMGFLGLLTPEDAGGSGWWPVGTCVVAEEAGRALSPLAWTGNLVAAAALAGDTAHVTLLQEVLAGRAEAVLARRVQGVSDDSGAVSGEVEIIGSDPAVLVLLDPIRGVLAVDCRRDGVSFEPVEAVDSLRPAGRITMRSAPAARLEMADQALLDDVATVLYCADSLGALASTSELIRTYLSERSAFERPLASFQALQHRLADLAVLEAACTALVRRAARTLDVTAKLQYRRSTVSAAHSYFVRHLVAAMDDCIQLAGGIGFTWEFPVHHAMRRTATNSFAARSHTASIMAMDVPVGADQGASAEEAFRQRARKVISEHMPYEVREGHRAPESPEQEMALRAWYAQLYDHQLLGGSWPAEWGGDPDHLPRHELIVIEELIAARAPRPIDQVQLASHLLLRFGTERQKTDHLPRIRAAADIWCQLFSEPDCGSDLAGITSRAEQQSDGSWRLTGQKTWTTDGHWAQMGVALLRTSTGPRRHHGLTAFVVPMSTPGIEVRPKLTIGSAFEFNDVFLDGAVVGPEHLLGEVGEGWAVAMSGLEIERFGVGGNVLLLDLLLHDLCDVARSLTVGEQPAYERDDIRYAVGALGSDAHAARAFVADHVEQALSGTDLPGDASVAKLLYSETYNRVARYGVELMAEHGPVPDTVGVQAGRLMDAWLWSRALTISGGSSEVMRNIIAKRRLGLPQ